MADLLPLAACKALLELDLTGTEVEDLTPLAGLPLTALELGFAQNVRDVAPLAEVRSLVYLGLQQCRVASLAPLAAVPGLCHMVSQRAAILS